MIDCSALWPSAACVLDKDADRTHTMWFNSGAFPFADEGVQQSNVNLLSSREACVNAQPITCNSSGDCQSCMLTCVLSGHSVHVGRVLSNPVFPTQLCRLSALRNCRMALSHSVPTGEIPEACPWHYPFSVAQKSACEFWLIPKSGGK